MRLLACLYTGGGMVSFFMMADLPVVMFHHNQKEK
jgi:hypothetical protein